MNNNALEDKRFELIKSHVLDPENSPLSAKDQRHFNRWKTAADLMDRYPNKRNTVKLLMEKYPEICQRQAYYDIVAAERLFNVSNPFNYDWWHSWLLNDIATHITFCRTKKDAKGWAMGHANLIKALGERPDDKFDPKIMEHHNFFITLNINGEIENLDLQQIFKLPTTLRKDLADSLITPISIDDAQKIMES